MDRLVKNIQEEYHVFSFKETSEDILFVFKEKIKEIPFVDEDFLLNVDAITFHIKRKHLAHFCLKGKVEEIPYYIKYKDGKIINGATNNCFNYIEPNLVRHDLYNDGFLYEFDELKVLPRCDFGTEQRTYQHVKKVINYQLNQKIKNDLFDEKKINKKDIEVFDFSLPKRFLFENLDIYLESVFQIEYIFGNKTYRNQISGISGSMKNYDFPYKKEFKKFMLKNSLSNPFLTDNNMRKLYYFEQYKCYLDYNNELQLFSRFRLSMKIKKFSLCKDYSEAKRYSLIGYYIFHKKYCLKRFVEELEKLKNKEYLFNERLYYSHLLSNYFIYPNYVLRDMAKNLLICNYHSSLRESLKYLKKASKLKDSDASMLLYYHYASYQYYNKNKMKRYLKLAKKYGHAIASKIY